MSFRKVAFAAAAVALAAIGSASGPAGRWTERAPDRPRHRQRHCLLHRGSRPLPRGRDARPAGRPAIPASR